MKGHLDFTLFLTKWPHDVCAFVNDPKNKVESIVKLEPMDTGWGMFYIRKDEENE